MAKLSDMKVLVMMTHGVEESEFTETIKPLKAEGAEVRVASPEGGEVQVMRHDEKTMMTRADMKTSDVNPSEFDALLLPGGTMNADKLRMDEDARRVAREMDRAGKPIAAICHAPWLLVSAGLVKDRKLTSYFTLQDDVRNAGATWVDEETVVDRNWLTSRSPKDIPAFNEKMLEAFAGARVGAR